MLFKSKAQYNARWFWFKYIKKKLDDAACLRSRKLHVRLQKCYIGFGFAIGQNIKKNRFI